LLVLGVPSARHLRQWTLDVGNGRQHTLAAVPLDVAVAQLDSLAATGASARRHARPAGATVLERCYDGNCGIPTRVEDLLRHERLNGYHHTSTWDAWSSSPHVWPTHMVIIVAPRLRQPARARAASG